MSTVVMHNVVSVDGFIADHNDDIGPLFDWYSNGDVAAGRQRRTRPPRRSRRHPPTTSGRRGRASARWWSGDTSST